MTLCIAGLVHHLAMMLINRILPLDVHPTCTYTNHRFFQVLSQVVSPVHYSHLLSSSLHELRRSSSMVRRKLPALPVTKPTWQSVGWNKNEPGMNRSRRRRCEDYNTNNKRLGKETRVNQECEGTSNGHGKT